MVELPSLLEQSQTLQDIYAQLNALSWRDWLLHLGTVLKVLVTISVINSMIIALLRFFGLYHPKYYRLFPRLPWRIFVRRWNAIQAWFDRTFRMGKQASGGFSSPLATLSQCYQSGQVHLGRAYAFGFPLLQPVGTYIQRHIFILSMTGGGKTTGVTTMVQSWNGSAMIVDPKGTITQSLAKSDTKRQWFTLDPYGIAGMNTVHFNVFDVIKDAQKRMGDTGAVLFAERTAMCLITSPEGTRTPYFYDINRAFVKALILHILTTHEASEHHLPAIRQYIVQGYRIFNDATGEEETKDNEAFELLIDSMMHNSAFEGVIIGGASAIKQASSETLGNVLSTLQQATQWLDLPVIQTCLKKSDFNLADLKTRDDIVLSLALPVLAVRGELKDLIRLMINMTGYIFELEQNKKGQCLMVVDELPSLGYNEMLEVVLPVARSQGITFCGIAQDIEILKKAYPKSWEGFLGNADVVLCMGSNHQATLDYISKALGNKVRIEKDRYSGRKIRHQVPVADADQVRRFLDPEGNRMIVLRAGKRPLRLVNAPYFKALPVSAYQADPDHREFWARRLSRKLFTRKRTIKPETLDQKIQEGEPHD